MFRITDLSGFESHIHVLSKNNDKIKQIDLSSFSIEKLENKLKSYGSRYVQVVFNTNDQVQLLINPELEISIDSFEGRSVQLEKFNKEDYERFAAEIENKIKSLILSKSLAENPVSEQVVASKDVPMPTANPVSLKLKVHTHCQLAKVWSKTKKESSKKILEIYYALERILKEKDLEAHRAKKADLERYEQELDQADLLRVLTKMQELKHALKARVLAQL